MKIVCPYCGETCETNCELQDGQHVICPKCREKFSYRVGAVVAVNEETSVEREELPIPLVPKNRKNAFVAFVEGLPGSLVVLQEAITLPFRKLTVVICDHCHTIDVFFAKKSELKNAEVSCDCGNGLLLREGHERWLQLVGMMRSEIALSEDYLALNNRFLSEDQAFSEDWSLYVNPKTPMRINRLKDDTDRLYKKLGATNSQMLLQAQHATSNTILGYANNIDGFAGSLISLAGIFGEIANRNAENAAGATAMGMQEMILRNEHAIDYYNDLLEEFTGQSQESARIARLKARTGYVSESELPYLNSEEVTAAQMRALSMVNDFVSRRARRAKFLMVFVHSFIAMLLAFLVFVIIEPKVASIVAGVIFFLYLMAGCIYFQDFKYNAEADFRDDLDRSVAASRKSEGTKS